MGLSYLHSFIHTVPSVHSSINCLDSPLALVFERFSSNSYACYENVTCTLPDFTPFLYLFRSLTQKRYFISTSILSWHAYFVEGNIFFVGIQPDKAGLDPPNKWTFASQIKKFSIFSSLTRLGTVQTIV